MDSKDIEAESIMSTHRVRAPRHLTRRHSVYISFHSDFFITVCLGGKSPLQECGRSTLASLPGLFLFIRSMDGAQLCSSLLAGAGGCCWPKPNLFAIKEPFDHIVFTGAFPEPIRGSPWQRG